MAQRVPLPNKFLWLLLFCLSACTQPEKDGTAPDVYVQRKDTALKQQSGFLLYRGQNFSGRLIELYPNGDTALFIPYLNGKEQGWSYTKNDKGQILEKRLYINGWKEGEHRGWWPNGNLKFVYHFVHDVNEGELQEFFENGKPFRTFHYKNGQEDGLQQMWWEDGKVRANYVVKDGEQYGLIGRKLCKNVNE